MNKSELLELIKDLKDEDEVLIEVDKGEAVDFAVIPITISCDDPTVIGYVLVKKELEH